MKHRDLVLRYRNVYDGTLVSIRSSHEVRVLAPTTPSPPHIVESRTTGLAQQNHGPLP